MNTENEQPNYYSILTANVRYDKNLKANEKLLFSEITALSNKYGYCTASNRYFAELYQVTDRVIRKWISDLAQLGYLKIILVSKDGKIIGRKMYPSNNFREEQMFRGWGTNVPQRGGTNVPLNITSNNNNNILSGKEPDPTPEPEEKKNSEITQKTSD